MNISYPAHIRVEPDGTWTVQSVAEHCRNTADIASASLQAAGLSASGFLPGLLHDAGKEKEMFREYLEAAARGQPVKRGSVNHTFCGVRYLLTHYHDMQDPDAAFRNIACELLAYAVGAHHGLFDCVDEHHRSGFLHRLEKEDIQYEESVAAFLEQCASQEELDGLFSKASQELSGKITTLIALGEKDETGSELSFYLAMLARLLLSAVIEGDRRDTATFMNKTVFPSWPEDMRPLWRSCLKTMEDKLADFPHDSPIQEARRTISQQCRDFAAKPGGVYRLNVPTGAGKTLSSLRYALAHAAQYNNTRIIFTAPLISILEQNAQVIRDYIQNDSLILEHHSNTVQTQEDGEELDERDLLTETWHAPIIITTLVQLLNTLFSGKTTCIRRMQALCGSIIVIDEVQTVPARMLTLFNLAINFLAEICGTTVILCSATQPCLEAVPHPLASEPEEMVPYDPSLWAAFRRTDLKDGGRLRLADIPSFAGNILAEADSLLIVCNKRDEARTLFQHLEDSITHSFHLSASMCMAHRRDVLAALNAALEQYAGTDEKVLCVSTQVIEAGVDISFARAIRLTAGMDSAVQSAGRVNRNGETDGMSPVYIVSCADENLGHLPDIQLAKQATEDLLTEFKKEPERFQNDLSSDEAIRCYYRQLYSKFSEDYQDYPVKGYPTLYSLLSFNDSYADEDCPAYDQFYLTQAFKLAGQKFQVFSDETVDVLVPYKEGKELILAFGAQGIEYDIPRQKELLEKAKSYAISLYPWEQRYLTEKRGITALCGGAVLALNPDFYDEKSLGLCLQPPEASNFLGV
ncbi:MAG: CRISPR-associated helicase Cas3' [Oscillospiraceae bacterium]|nr:CRISPR-associated helicase Cas3' [Oscillospiraceae bacterium]